ncbi:MAG: DNA mismatch repair endonuclease MutL, partial [Bacteroidota bacterium]
MKHILDEFQRLALAHPDLFLTLHHNENEVFHLQASNLRQRIVGIFGNSCNKKLVPIGEETNVMKIHGYVGKPEFAKKTRGEQLFFVNKRFIKSSYLNHAVMSAYEGILQKETFPLYVIFLEMDPAMIDVNVHPTKQEIKFEDEKLVYNYLKVTVRHALGQYSITPTLDFNQEVGLTRNMKPLNVPTKVVNTDKPDNFTIPSKGNFDTDREKANIKNWQKLFDGLEAFEVDQTETSEEQEAPINAMTIGSQWELDGDQDQQKSFSKARKAPYQIHSKYIVSHIKSGFLLIDQQAAHERIQYERYLTAMWEGNSPTQQELFPKTITLPVQDADLLRHMLYQINTLGFDIREFGNNAFIIHGLPADVYHVLYVSQVHLVCARFWQQEPILREYPIHPIIKTIGMIVRSV